MRLPTSKKDVVSRSVRDIVRSAEFYPAKSEIRVINQNVKEITKPDDASWANIRAAISHVRRMSGNRG